MGKECWSFWFPLVSLSIGFIPFKEQILQGSSALETFESNRGKQGDLKVQQNSNSVMLGNGRSQNFGQWFDKTSDSALTESHIRMSSKTCFIISSLCQQDHLLLNLSKM